MRLLSILFISFSLLLTGCQLQNEQQANKDNNLVKVNDPTGDYKEEKSHQEIAEHLSQLATQIPDVNDSTAVVAGNYAVVGIDVNKDLDRSRVGTIKYTVAESLKKDPYGANAVVVADADTLERLDHMANKIADGHPVDGIMDELAAIVGRIMPEVPTRIHEEGNDDPTNKNDQQLPPDEEKELDKLQDEQANHKK